MLDFLLQMKKKLFKVVPAIHSIHVILDKTYVNQLPQLFWFPLL